MPDTINISNLTISPIIEPINMSIEYMENGILVGETTNTIVEEIERVDVGIVTEDVQVTGPQEVISLTINYTQAIFEYVPPPPTRDSPGVPGQQSFDDDYHYICVAPNRWARTILTKGW